MGEDKNIPQLPRFSYSKIKNFYNCRLGYYKNYIEKVQDKMDSGLSEFGTFVHLVLEKYARKELELYELLDYYKNNFDSEIKSSFKVQLTEKFSKDLRENYYTDGLNYFTNFTGFDDLKILDVEYEFNSIIDNKFVFTGKIDLICEDKNGNIVLIDHKSKNGFKSKVERKEYTKQLLLYAHAVYERYNRFPMTICFNMFRKNQWIKEPFDVVEYYAAMDWLRRSVDEILSVDWQNFKIEPISNFVLELDNPAVPNNVAMYNTDTLELKFGDNYSTFSELPAVSNDFFGRNLCSFRKDCNYCVKK